MATPAKNSAPASTEADTFDVGEVSRVVSLVRHELSVLNQDAKRKRPLYSKSSREAVARRDAAFKALVEFSDHLGSLKKD